MKNPGKKHWIACKRILRYLKSTPQLGLQYRNDQNDNEIELTGYCDADWLAMSMTENQQLDT